MFSTLFSVFMDFSKYSTGLFILTGIEPYDSDEAR